MGCITHENTTQSAGEQPHLESYRFSMYQSCCIIPSVIHHQICQNHVNSSWEMPTTHTEKCKVHMGAAGHHDVRMAKDINGCENLLDMRKKMFVQIESFYV